MSQYIIIGGIMNKIKSFRWTGLLNIIKCCMLGIITTLIGIVFFAIVLKFTDFSNVIISYVNDVIKALSIFVMIICLKKKGEDKLLLKAIFVGILYAVLSFVVFSIINGQFVFNLSFLYDLLFAVIVSVIASVIVNITFKRNA